MYPRLVERVLVVGKRLFKLNEEMIMFFNFSKEDIKLVNRAIYATIFGISVIGWGLIEFVIWLITK